MVSIIVPVFNEEGTVSEILSKLISLPVQKEIIVVDDGSTDTSPQHIMEFASRSSLPIKTIFLKNNRGKSKAVQIGIKHATGKYIIVQDGDLEYDPNDILKLIKTLERFKLDVIYGSRFLNKKIPKNMGFLYWLANRWITFFTNALYFLHLSDQNTCYKLIRSGLLRSLNLQTKGFDFCAEITAKLSKRGYDIIEIPINYSARPKHKGKKIRWFHAFLILKTLIIERFKH